MNKRKTQEEITKIIELHEKCFYCNSPITKKNGFVRGVQRYKCHACGKQFLGGFRLNNLQLWQEYCEGKQTYAQLSVKYGCSIKTIQRRIDKYKVENTKPTARSVVS